MANVTIFLSNRTGLPLFVTGSKGSDWGNSVVPKEIQPATNAAYMLVGEITKPGPSAHWGWIFLALRPNGPNLLQVYVSIGIDGGTDNCAIQYYDGGENTSGQTVAQSTATLLGRDTNTPALSIDAEHLTWMSKLRSETPPRKLHQITIPGTHDSGTWNLFSPSRCQQMTIEEQLLGGVRYFDIRVDAGLGSLRIVHGGLQGSGNTDYYFQDLMGTFLTFLKATEETIIVQVKPDRGDPTNLHDTVLKLLNAAFAGETDRLYLLPIRKGYGAIPDIASLKGKLVLMRRYEYTSPDSDDAGTELFEFGRGREYNKTPWSMPADAPNWTQTQKFGWPDGGKNEPGDNKSFLAQNFPNDPSALSDYRNRSGLSFIIQDKYSFEGLIPPAGRGVSEAKFELVKSYLESARNGEAPDSWFLNFSSGSEVASNPEYYANIINPLLTAYLNASSKPAGMLSFGTILMDFVDQELLKLVIGANG